MIVVHLKDQREQILEAVDYVFSQEMYIPVSRDTFEEACPNPTFVIHVIGRNPAEAVMLLQIETVIAGRMKERLKSCCSQRQCKNRKNFRYKWKKTSA